LRALITGIDGFVGPYLARELRAQTDWSLVGLGRHPQRDDGYTSITADLLDREHVARVVGEIAPRYIFHLAAQSHVPTSQEDGGATLHNNIAAQVNLLDACRTLPEPPRILVVGSGEEYGLVRADEMPIREEQPFRPTNPYAVSKVAQDLLGWQYFHSYGLPIVRVRPFNHLGPGQSDRFAIAAFARQVAEVESGLRPPVVRVGNLDAQRDFLDVRDVVRAYRLALTRGVPGEVYNIGGGAPIRMGAALDQLLALASRPIAVEFDPTRLRPSDVPILIADTSRLRAATGWRPEIPFEQSLRDTLNWWRERVGVAPVAP
jgi:GDP-4-dehydro-6-deoxy-D-mannose reductase